MCSIMVAKIAGVSAVCLLLVLLAIPGVTSMTEPSCEVKEYCPGQEPGTFGAGSTVQAILADLRNTFCGCKRIGGSVNVFFPSMPTDNYNLTEDDFSFLYHLEEVGGGVTFINVPSIDRLTLPNLVLIRGNNLPSSSLVANGFALSLVNSTVDRFVLPRLVEITVGSMQLYNSTWCGYYTVNWEDIFEAGSVHLLPNNDELNFTNELSMRCPSEDRQCSGCASEYCWVSGDTTTCQTLTKTVCPAFCPERCSELDGLPFCCNTKCAAGCSGGIAESHCVACDEFNNNGTCVDICPPKFIYDVVEQRLVVNPDGRVAAGNQCLENCPRGLFELSGSCVVSCPENHMVENNVCTPCGGPCPQGTECQGWSGTDAVRNDDIMEEFLNNECAIVNGHIRFNLITAECRNQDPAQFCDPSHYLSEETLQRFRFIKVIRGQLQISGWNLDIFPSLPSVIDYFRNVEYIGSLNISLDTVNTERDALVISTNPGLQRVDLSRLQWVRYGNVRVRDNPALCYVGDFQTTTGSDSVYLSETQLILPSGSTNFMSVEDCNAAGMTCHGECEPSRRCWGPGDTNCVACANYRYPPLWRCVPNCEEYNDTFPNNDTRACEQCHNECIGCCNQGPFQCKACCNFRIVHNAAGDSVSCHNDTECVSACPVNYYADGMDCKLCHELCVGGCTGPGDFVGQRGCNTCDVVNFDHNDTQISCVAQCPVSTYRHQLEQAIGPVPASNGACHPCHDLCETCFGPLNTECFGCKYVALENTSQNGTVPTCLAECPSDRYKAASKVCRPCHEECNGCTGQGNKMCLRCKNLRMIVTQAEALTTYECLDSCPNSSYWIDYTNSNTCLPCHPLCATCIAAGSSNCTECKALQALSAELNHTVTVNGYERILYTCKATTVVNSTGAFADLPLWVMVLVVAGCILLLLLVLSVIVCLLCVAGKERRKEVLRNGAPLADNPVNGCYDELAVEMEMLPQPKVAPNLSQLTVIAEDSLRLEEVLGSGAFGTVHKGYWRPEGEDIEYTVAVKMLKEGTAAEATSELLNEGAMMASMDHANIVRLFGISMGRKMMLVSQFVPLGSLLGFLRKHKERLNAKNMLTFSQQIAEGMAYLELNRMVHGDLAARNVLVESASKVKITDFGLTKCLDVGELGYKAGQEKVPVRWLPPECLRSRKFSHKSDVWAFGVTVWEILTFGARPYKERKSYEILKYLESGCRLVQPPTCTIDLYKVLLKCWLLEPTQRPTFSTLADWFRSMCSDPLHYLSTTVDRQIEDYSALPCNDAEEVDKHVYESPLDEEGYAVIPLETGQYDYPYGDENVQDSVDGATVMDSYVSLVATQDHPTWSTRPGGSHLSRHDTRCSSSDSSGYI